MAGKSFDVVVVGGGNNALAAVMYLTKFGGRCGCCRYRREQVVAGAGDDLGGTSKGHPRI